MNVMSNPSLSFVVLTWNSARFIDNCIAAIINKCQEEGIPFEVIVVDNGSVDETMEILSRIRRDNENQITLISLGRNRGTTYSRNLGLARSRGEYLCIIDSDTVLGGGSLKGIISHLNGRRETGLVAPRLLLPNGRVQNSVKRFPTLFDKLVKIPRILLGLKTKNYDFYEQFPFKELKEVESAISACWFFRRDLLETVGYLDENIFYAPEDVDYSLRVWKSGHVNVFYPFFTVLHHTQQITHRKPFSRNSISHLMGLAYYYRKHGGWFSRPRFTKDVS